MMTVSCYVFDPIFFISKMVDLYTTPLFVKSSTAWNDRSDFYRTYLEFWIDTLSIEKKKIFKGFVYIEGCVLIIITK